MKPKAWCLILIASGALVAARAQARIVDFEKDEAGKPPAGFTLAVTNGPPGVWIVTQDSSAPGRGRVLAQTDGDATRGRFPLAVFDAVTAADVDLSVRFKPISGRVDQAAGLIWRYRDANNYYIVRANALENNVVLYKVEGGKRTDLPLKGEGRTYGRKVPVPSGAWSELRVTAAGTLFTVFLNGQRLFEVEDGTFASAGKIGLWTKADSVTYFDDLWIATK